MLEVKVTIEAAELAAAVNNRDERREAYPNRSGSYSGPCTCNAEPHARTYGSRSSARTRCTRSADELPRTERTACCAPAVHCRPDYGGWRDPDGRWQGERADELAALFRSTGGYGPQAGAAWSLCNRNA